MTSRAGWILLCILLLTAEDQCLAATKNAGAYLAQDHKNRAASAINSVENLSSVDVQLPRYTTNSQISVPIGVIRDLPVKMTFCVSRMNSKPPPVVMRDAKWIPFSTNFFLDLGPEDCERLAVWYGFAWEKPSRTNWNRNIISLWHSPFILFITNPPQETVSQPFINVLGYTLSPIFSIKYGVHSGGEESQERFGFFDPWNGFKCYDIPLREGANVVRLRCQDLASNVLVTNLTFTLDLKNDHTPPSVILNFPKNGTKMFTGDDFSVTGFVDDFTAKINAEMACGGRTNVVSAMVGPHNGSFYIPHIAFPGPEGWLLLTATDAAGNRSQTNLHLFRSSLVLSMNPPEQEGLSLSYKISGTLSNTAGQAYTVWVNGVKARIEDNCRWSAEHVRSSTPYGLATFNASAIPISDGHALTSPGNTKSLPANPDFVLVSAAYPTNGLNLECIASHGGQLKIHLSGTLNQSFIVFASTNLTEWVPLMTNFNSGDSFEYVDPAAGDYHCRYYRVLPIQ